MTDDKITQLLMMIKDSVPEDKLMYIKSKLVDADDSKFDTLMMKTYYNPTHILLFSIFLGALGVDRFMIGDTGIGVAKLLLGWFTCGIWPIIDIFMSFKRAKEKNYDAIMIEL